MIVKVIVVLVTALVFHNFVAVLPCSCSYSQDLGWGCCCLYLLHFIIAVVDAAIMAIVRIVFVMLWSLQLLQLPLQPPWPGMMVQAGCCCHSCPPHWLALDRPNLTLGESPPGGGRVVAIRICVITDHAGPWCHCGEPTHHLWLAAPLSKWEGHIVTCPPTVRRQ